MGRNTCDMLQDCVSKQKLLRSPAARTKLRLQGAKTSPSPRDARSHNSQTHSQAAKAHVVACRPHKASSSSMQYPHKFIQSIVSSGSSKPPKRITKARESEIAHDNNRKREHLGNTLEVQISSPHNGKTQECMNLERQLYTILLDPIYDTKRLQRLMRLRL